MPDKYEPGSHNAIGIIGLSEGVKWVAEQTVEKLASHELDLVRTFIEGVSDVEGLTYYGPQGVRNRIGVFSVRVDGYEPHELSAILESHYGILTRSGIHCAPLAHDAIGTAALGRHDAAQLRAVPEQAGREVRHGRAGGNRHQPVGRFLSRDRTLQAGPAAGKLPGTPVWSAPR